MSTGHYPLFGPHSTYGDMASGKVTQVTLRIAGMKMSLWLTGWHPDGVVRDATRRWNKDAHAVSFQIGTTERDSSAFQPMGELINLA